MIKAREVTKYDIATAPNISTVAVSRALKDDPVVNKKQKRRFLTWPEKWVLKGVTHINHTNTTIIRTELIVRNSSLKKGVNKKIIKC
ncbi:hypothetical protein BH20BAC1_BH20BAC1_18540 [soil metagenome]